MTEKNQSVKLAEDVAKAAFTIHGTDEVAANKFIDETVEGTGTWSDSVRGLARCVYQLDHLGKRQDG